MQWIDPLKYMLEALCEFGWHSMSEFAYSSGLSSTHAICIAVNEVGGGLNIGTSFESQSPVYVDLYHSKF